MKSKYISLILLSTVAQAAAPDIGIRPATSWIATNLLNKSSAADARTGLGTAAEWRVQSGLDTATPGNVGTNLLTSATTAEAWAKLGYLPTVSSTSGGLRRSIVPGSRSLFPSSVPYYVLEMTGNSFVGNLNADGVGLYTDGTSTLDIQPGLAATNAASAWYRLFELSDNTFQTTNAYDGALFSMDSPAPITSLAKPYALTPASGYVASFNTTANYGSGGAGVTRWFFGAWNANRIRRAGYVRAIRFYVASTNALSNLNYTVWRKDGSVYDRVHLSEDVWPLTPNTTNTFTFVTPLAVNADDLQGWKLTGTGAPANSHCAATTWSTASTIYYVSNPGTDPDQNYAWASQAPLAGYGMEIQALMDPPDMLTIGDSILSGAESNRGGMEQIQLLTIGNTHLGYHLSTNYNTITESASIGGNTVAQISTRFTADGLTPKPQILILNGGINSINTGVTNITTLTNTLIPLLVSAQAAGILPVYMACVPMDSPTAASEALEYARVTLNTSMSNACVGLNIPFVALDTLMGDAFALTSAPGTNGYTQKVAYAAGQHWNAAGYAVIAGEVINVIDAYLLDNGYIW